MDGMDSGQQVKEGMMRRSGELSALFSIENSGKIIFMNYVGVHGNNPSFFCILRIIQTLLLRILAGNTAISPAGEESAEKILRQREYDT
jgi:hypothetical protein